MTEKQIIGHLPIRKQKYMLGQLEGKSKKQAALDAGYSEATVPGHLETADYKEAFQQLARKKISPSKILRRINQGMDATETKFFTMDGKVTDSRETINYKERREYALLAAQFGNYWTPRQEMQVTKTLDPVMQKRILELYEKLGVHELEFEKRKELRSSYVPLLATKNDE